MIGQMEAPSRQVAVARLEEILARETGTIRRDWGGRIPIALAYPNTYYLGMSNLGLHAIYSLLNGYPDIVCERVFYDSFGLSLESAREMMEFPVVAFSFSFEEDYLRALEMLRLAHIPLHAEERDETHPLLLAGGVATTANPEPLAPFFDAFAIGEGEAILPPLVEALRRGLREPRDTLLRQLAALPGMYVPRFYQVKYGDDGLITSIKPEAGVPHAVHRQCAQDLDAFPVGSAILTPDTEFGHMYLMEVARGCGRGCRFCLAGHIFHPFRARSLSTLLAQAREGLRHRERVGLVGTAVFDHPQLGELLHGLEEMGAMVSTSSLRLDALIDELLRSLKAGRNRTVTLAPEAGSLRLRRLLAKPFSDHTIRRAAKKVESFGFPELKLYFMLGLPGEDEADVQALAHLVKDLRSLFSRQMVVQLTPFVPKAQTALERMPMARRAILEERIAHLRRELEPAGIRVRAESPRWMEMQAILARGDRRLARALAIIQGRSPSHWRRALASAEIEPGFYLERERAPEETLPWAVVAHP
jgi:radical SAM superfamily enzyme YgiQ (UPF0313 family)